MRTQNKKVINIAETAYKRSNMDILLIKYDFIVAWEKTKYQQIMTLTSLHKSCMLE